MKRLFLLLSVLLALNVFAAAPADSIVSARTASWAPAPVEKSVGTRFAWGAEFGSSVDLSANDMSSIDISASFGVSHRWIMLAGVGAGANMMINNSCRTYPIFAVFRTDFSSFMKILFVELRGGMALNYLPDEESQTGPYGGFYLGFNLARSKKFRSYITAGYTFVGRRDIHNGDIVTKYDPLSLASVRLGVTF